jgi:hypothetical protein
VSDDSDDPDSYKSLLAHIKSVENGTLEEDKKAVEEELKIRVEKRTAELAAIDAAIHSDAIPVKPIGSLASMEEGGQVDPHQVLAATASAAAASAAAAAGAVSGGAPGKRAPPSPRKLVSVQSIRSSFISFANMPGIAKGVNTATATDTVVKTCDVNAAPACVSDPHLVREFMVAETAKAAALVHQESVAQEKLEKRLAKKTRKARTEGGAISTKKALANDGDVMRGNEAAATVVLGQAVPPSDRGTWAADDIPFLLLPDTNDSHTKKKIKKKTKVKKKTNVKIIHVPVDSAEKGTTRTTVKATKKSKKKKKKPEKA